MLAHSDDAVGLEIVLLLEAFTNILFLGLRKCGL
jgi:hypothetical protein